MKTASMIKLIGILSILFGVSGIFHSLAHIFIIEMAEVDMSNFSPRVQQLISILGYSGTLVYSLYLAAGIFFLVKKSFSVNMMNLALAVSMLFVLIPLCIINKSDASGYLFDYRISLSNLLSPAIDFALLIGVWYVRKSYFKEPDKTVVPTFLTPARLRVLSILGLICLSIPLTMFGLWQYAYNQADNQLERVAVFKGFFPSFLHERYDIANISLVSCLLAIILSSVSLKLKDTQWKTMNLVCLILASALFLLNLFQMM